MNWMSRLKKIEPEPMPQDVAPGVGKDFEADVDAVVADLNRIWADGRIEMDMIPIEQRRRAGALDQEMTQAANRGDLAGARAALEEWERCWVPRM